MKLRIKGNSLRLRITPSELTRLLDRGRIEETVYFASDPDARLTYALEQIPDADRITVRYTPGEVTVLVSSSAAQCWAGGRDPGLYGQAMTDHGILELALERDFACLDKSDKDNLDTFPNPKQGAAC
jgi:uncharacterized protein DUF7009